jgi:hypothetical protein
VGLTLCQSSRQSELEEEIEGSCATLSEKIRGGAC